MTEIIHDSMKSRRLMRWFEVAFDGAYLLVAIFIGVYMLFNRTWAGGLLSGAMALILAGGDAFHLIPRMAMSVSRDKERMIKALGFGKFVTSITMTIFYVLLFHIGLMHFAPLLAGGVVKLIYFLAGLRIVLCLFKQNGWACNNPSTRWAVLRNIPFLILGLLVALFFFMFRSAGEQLQYMWLAIVLSFVFYIPVVIGVHRNPKLGMLMLPKSCMYIWMLVMCATI